MKMYKTALELPQAKLKAFCQRWRIQEFALFGSILRDDFGPDSDIDALVTFAPEAVWSLLDHVEMQYELEDLLGRKVDLVSRQGIANSQNYIRKQEILNSAQVIYALA
jgi:uncharacterized protein